MTAPDPRRPPFGDEQSIENLRLALSLDDRGQTLLETRTEHLYRLIAAIDRRDACIAHAGERAADAYQQLWDIAHGLQQDGTGAMSMAYDTAAGLVKGVLLALRGPWEPAPAEEATDG